MVLEKLTGNRGSAMDESVDSALKQLTLKARTSQAIAHSLIRTNAGVLMLGERKQTSSLLSHFDSILLEQLDNAFFVCALPLNGLGDFAMP